MSFSSLEQWWEEWQLRVLVLASLGTQLYLLAYFAPTRKLSHLPHLYRFFAYLGGDALAIYALAALFNRQKKLQCRSYSSAGGSKDDLEVLWAPILLMHLGGQIGISAYDIEDNEQWKRHLAIAVSQVTVTIYVFCHSWSPLADKRLLAAAILLFIVGVFRCLEKPFALKRASFNTLVNSFNPAPRAVSSTNREVELEQYVQGAKNLVDCNQDHPTLDEEGKMTHIYQLNIPDKLFVDFAYVYPERLAKLKAFWLLDDGNFFKALRIGISRTFNLIFTKLWQFGDENRDPPYLGNIFSNFLWLTTLTLPIISIILFHISHKQAYRGTDIKITFLLLYITYCLEIISMGTVYYYNWRVWPGKVGQSSIIVPDGKRRHIAKCFSCKGLLSQFCVENSYSSKKITFLIRNYVKDGWRNHINDVDSYWKFTDTRGHKTLGSLEQNGCVVSGILRESTEKPLDESVILWHIATDLCFYHKGTPPNSECARISRQISKYMVHLLDDNPEMLMPGSRSNFFTDASKELMAIQNKGSLLVENRLTEVFIKKVQSESGLFHEAWVIAQDLMKISDDGKMWEVIRGVWVEMLCFSAGRCRGYLHAKNLGHGGEYLTFVSLVMSYGGLETFAERQQRVHLQLKPEERKKRAARHELASKERVTHAEERILKEAATNQEAGASTELEIV